MELNYEEDIRIDPDALDVEWLGQPELMRKYAKHAADRKAAMDEAKESLDIVKAHIEMEIRANPVDYGLAKPTESSIQSTILLQDEFQEASKVYQDSRYEYEIALAAVRAVDQRKTALENLVKLLNASYFAGPQSPRDLSYENLKRLEDKQANNKVKINSRRRRKED